MPSQLAGDYHIAGHLSAQTMSIPTGTLLNAGVNGSADIGASKMEHRHKKLVTQVHGSAATTERRPIYSVRAATATIQSFRCGVTVANVGAATIVVDLLKNGSTILSGTITLDNANGARTFESAPGFTSTALVANDWLEVNITATAGGGTLGQGLLIELEVDEKAS